MILIERRRELNKKHKLTSFYPLRKRPWVSKHNYKHVTEHFNPFYNQPVHKWLIANRDYINTVSNLQTIMESLEYKYFDKWST